MKGKILIASIGAAVCLGAVLGFQAGPDHKLLFEKAKFAMETKGDLPGAIKLFQEIVAKYPKEKEYAAKAQLYIGLCYEKLGNSEAVKAYELVLKNFSDRPEEVAVARERLAAIHQGISSELSITNLPSVETDFWPNSLSPNGTKLLGVSYEIGTDIVYLDILSGKIVPITHFDWSEKSSWAWSPIWSPDGKEFAYEQCPNDPKKYKCEVIVSRIEGNPRTLISTEAGEITPCDWLKDGSAIVAVWRHRDNSLTLGLVPLSGGSFKRLCLVQKNMPIPSASASPDGRFIVFEEGGANAGNIRIISVDGSSSSLLVDHPADDEEARWSPDGKHVVFLSNRLGRWALWAVAMKDGRAVGQPFMIKDEMNDTTLFNWTAQGFACLKWTQSDDIFLQSIDPKTNILVGKPQLLAYAPTGKNAKPRWSPDGKFLAFISRAPGSPTPVRVVVRRQEDGKTQEYATPLPYTLSFPSYYYLTWLPDGSGLVIVSALTVSPGRSAVFYKLDFGSGKWSSLTLPGFYINYSRDGTSVFYGRDASKESEGGIFERNLGTGVEKCIYRPEKSKAVTFHGLRFSRDFRRLAFVIWTSLESGEFLCQLQTLDLESGQARIVYSGPEERGTPSWSPDGRYLLNWCYDKSGWQKDIALFPAEGGPMQRLNIDLSWPEGAGIYGRFTSLDWSQDGTQIALTVWSAIEEDYLIKNVIPKDRR